MPDTTPDERKGDQHRRDAHDKATLIILTFTLIAAGCAAGFTGWQAWIARDQEHRALRAYIVTNAVLSTDAGEKSPGVQLMVENMGQTPAYDLTFVTWNFILGQYETTPEVGKVLLTYDCSSRYAADLAKSEGHTFSKTHVFRRGIGTTMNPINSIDEAFTNARHIVVYGTLCYRDIFSQAHTSRVCYQWYSPSSSPERCPNEIEGEQDN